MESRFWGHGSLLLLRLRHAATAPAARIGFSQLHDEVGVSSSGPTGVDAGIKSRSRFQTRVPQQLPHQFISTRVGIEDDFRGQMAELVRSDLDSEVPQDGLRDSDLNCRLAPRPACPRDEQLIGTFADHRRGNLVPIRVESVGKHGRNLKLEEHVILGLIAPQGDERWPAPSLRPVQMALEVERGQILHAQRDMDEEVDRERALEVDERSL